MTRLSASWGAVFLLVSLLALVVPAQASLEFSTLNVKVKAEPGQRYVDVQFPFKNTGDQPVDITNLKSSCGCTSVSVGSRHVLPGAEDAVSARFDIGNRQGLQRKQVTVITAEGSTQLMLEVDIPVVFEISNRLLVWQRNAAPEPKSVELKFSADLPARITSVAAYPTDAATTQLVEVEEGRRYRVEIAPATTDAPSRSVVRVEYALASGRTEVVTVFTRVQ